MPRSSTLLLHFPGFKKKCGARSARPRRSGSCGELRLSSHEPPPRGASVSSARTPSLHGGLPPCVAGGAGTHDLALATVSASTSRRRGVFGLLGRSPTRCGGLPPCAAGGFVCFLLHALLGASVSSTCTRGTFGLPAARVAPFVAAKGEEGRRARGRRARGAGSSRTRLGGRGRPSGTSSSLSTPGR